jgi:acetyltransferase-like isoleucine patch superfamily enzyme
MMYEAVITEDMSQKLAKTFGSTGTRWLIYLEVANVHRNGIVAPLARTLLAGGHDVLIACESRVEFTYSDGERTHRGDNSKAIQSFFNDGLEEKLAVFDILDRGGDSSSPQAASLRTAFIRGLVEKFQPDRIVIWNGNFQHQESTVQTLNELGYRDRTLHLEVAWFSQKEFVYLDPKGVNMKSSICHRAVSPLSPLQRMRLDQWYGRLQHGRIGAEQIRRRPGPQRIFVPLQVDTDTSIQEGSPFLDMRSFIKFLEEWVPSDCEVILKAHPKAHYPYVLGTRRRDFHIRASSSVDELMAEADIVLGVNSTVLMEAAALGKRVVAFGRGLFSGCRVLSEAIPNDSPSEVFSRPIDTEARASFFYHLVFERQISIAELQRQNVAHLFSREPFNQCLIGPNWTRRIFCINAQEGKSMIKVGKSKIARTASLDVEKGGQILIGDDCEVRHHAVLEVSGRYNGTIEIGNHSVIGVGNWLQGSGRIQIGNDVIIGPYVAIVSTNHSYEDASTPVAKQPLKTGEVIIEDDVWIGAHCTIAQNVRIGAHSIIGANSFVNTDIPPYSVAVGSPAKVIKTRK